MLFRDDKTGAVDIAIDRTNPNVMFAALWEAYRIEYQMSSGGPGSGLFKSTDGGETWTRDHAQPGPAGGHRSARSASRSPAPTPNRVYALVENENGGLFSSDDAGATWKLVNDGRNIRQRAFYYTHVFADPKNKDIVYVLNTSAFRSTDGGKTLDATSAAARTAIITTSGSIPTTRARRARQRRRRRGHVQRRDGRSARGRRRTFRPTQFYHVITTEHVPYHVCGAQQDNSDAVRAEQHRPGGGAAAAAADAAARRSLQRRRRRAGLHRARPEGPRRLLRRREQRQRSSRGSTAAPASCAKSNPYPRFFSGETVERGRRALAVDLSDHLLAGRSERPLHVVAARLEDDQRRPDVGQDQRRPHAPRSEDDAGLGRADHARHEQPGGLRDGLRARRPARRDVNVIWAGSDDGLVHVTRDGGKTWTNVTPKDMPDFGRVSQIDASAFDAGTAYVAVKKPLLDDFAPYIFRTHDFGKTWTKIVTGIRADDYVHVGARGSDAARPALRRHAARRLRLVDDGDHWQSLSNGLPDTPVHDIWVEANDVAIATHGRGFYILDDVGAAAAVRRRR